MAAAVAGAQGPAPARLVIRPLAQAPRASSGYEERSWAELQAAVQAVFEQKPLPGGSQEAVYRLVEAVCVSGHEESLARRLEAECDGHVGRALAAATGAASSGAALLRGLEKAWQDHCTALHSLCGLFLYLDRTQLRSHRGGAAGAPRSLWDCGLQLFRTHLEGQEEVYNAALLGTLDLIDAARRAMAGAAADAAAAEPEGSQDTGQLLGSLVSMFSKLGLYDRALEPKLLERTGQFYKGEAAELVTRVTSAEYLAHCERRLEEETGRCAAVLEARSEPALLSRVRAELLGQHREEVLEQGFGALVQANALEDLARLYRLFESVGALPSVRKAWSKAIKVLGAGILAAGEGPEEAKGIVPALMDLRARLSEILARAFKGSQDFAIALKDAFAEFLNAGPQNLPAKLLARHADEMLRNERACGDEELEEAIERIMGLFRLVSAKDAFEAFYKKDLSKRLLLQRSASADAEALMVEKLRSECGSGFTSKLEGMFRDVDLSKGLLEVFAAKPETKAILTEGGMELSVAVLTSGLWPTQPPSGDVSYPPGPAQLQELFTSFYTAQHRSRSLRWCPLLGQCILRASSEGGSRKELVVSHFQAIVLLLFNSARSLTCREIAAATRIPAGDLQRTLQSLALHKTVKLLLKEPKGREVNDDDVFSVNNSFTHKLYHITVSQISAKEQREEEADVEQRVFEDRQHEVDAAVVRIMKANQRLSHQQLLAEVFKAVRFPAQAPDVKKRIESLIEREYLERDPEQAAFYNYLA